MPEEADDRSAHLQGLSRRRLAEADREDPERAKACAAHAAALWSPSTIHGNPKRGTGILHNELYIGRLVWNRLRFLKDPGYRQARRRGRIHRPSGSRQDVPELRIVDDELWQAVQARYASVQHKWKSAEEASASTSSVRPKYLFSGLTKCGECGAGFIMYSREHLGCFGARDRGTCTN